MNKTDYIILAVITGNGMMKYPDLVKKTGFGTSVIKASIRKLKQRGFLDDNCEITKQTEDFIAENKPERAIILAAGMGLRMFPINKNPKSLIVVNGTPLIERAIKQLHEVGITDINVVVGYEAERFEYLVEKFGVKLVQNDDYISYDSMKSLSLVEDKLENSYVISGDIYFSKNPFYKREYFSWYGMSGYIDEDSFIRADRNMEILYAEEGGGNAMVGIAYLCKAQAEQVRENIQKYIKKVKHKKDIWEHALFVEKQKINVYARVMLGQSAYRIKTYEDLKELDSESKNLRSRKLEVISKALGVVPEDITDISAILKSMTNKLMKFSVEDKEYLLRVPGEGSNQLTNRRQEAVVYGALKGCGITENVVYIDGEAGYKISEFYENAINCDSSNLDEVRQCLLHVKKMHDMKLKVDHRFDPFARLEEYERLRNDKSIFQDYEKTRAKVYGLKEILDRLPKDDCLCHIDSISDNFIFTNSGLVLIDWEYAGMCDPVIDVVMFCLYAGYDKEQIATVMDIYFGGEPDKITKFKFFAYMSICGLLWTEWSEYKARMGVKYGEYMMSQFKYSQKYYKIAMEFYKEGELDKLC